MQRSFNLLRRTPLQLLQRQCPPQTLLRSLHCSIASRASGASSSSSSGSEPPTPPALKASQAFIVLPQLSPRMTRGSVVRWLVGEGEPLSPHQVFLHVRTDELTEDGSDYLLEVESHESGVLKRILVQAPTTPSEGKEEAAAATLPVGTPLAVFEDPDFAEGDRPRSDFLWQAYVKEGALRQGSCTPQRQEQQEEHEEHHASAADAKAKKQRKAKEPSFSPAAKSKNKGHHAGATDEAGNGRKKPKA